MYVALYLLTNNMSNGNFTKSEPGTSRITTSSPRSDITRPKKTNPYSIAYEDIDEDLVKKAAIKTKGGCGPSGLEADNRRRILVFNHFGFSPSDPRKSIANFI